MGIKCAAILNLWDCQELLPYALRQWEVLGIEPIIVYSNISNHKAVLNNTQFLKAFGVRTIQCEPLHGLIAMDNERRKRSIGLEYTKREGFTHFITADADEFYEPFKVDWDLAGTVVACQTYFKSPMLTIGLDTTLVPFVHKVTPEINYAFNRRYPFAWDSKGIRIDPTRSFNINDGVKLDTSIVLHHYSYLRKDITQKIDNSSARANMNKAQIIEDMAKAKPGYFCRTYAKTLYEAPNLFSLPTDW